VKPAGRIAAMKGRGGKKVSTAAKAGKGASTSKGELSSLTLSENLYDDSRKRKDTLGQREGYAR